MRSDVILSIQQFHWALFTKVLHDGTTCLYGGYAMDDNGKWIVCQHCRWEALDHLVRIHPSIVWSFEVSPNGARGNRRLFSQGQATGPRRWQIFFLQHPKENCKEEKIDQRSYGKDTPKDISFGRQSEAGLPRAGNWSKQVSLAGKAPSSFLAQINYWSTRLLSHLHEPVHIYVQVRVDVDIKPIWVSNDKKYLNCQAPTPVFPLRHTCKKRVMLRRRLFWPKKNCGKSA